MEKEYISVSGIKLSLDYKNEDLLKKAVNELKVSNESVIKVELGKLSVDARQKNNIHFIATLNVYLKNTEDIYKSIKKAGKNNIIMNKDFDSKVPVLSKAKKSPVVVGAGPAGLFAALVLAKAGLCPILIERGKEASLRKIDVDKFKATRVLDTESNIQFGEGGAGTFSDGKLSTGIKNPRCRYILEEFVKAGAPDEILWDAKPHVGTDKLVPVVENIREKIKKLGGKVLFGHKLTDLKTEKDKIIGIKVKTETEEKEIETDYLILAIGHSARDTFEMLHDKQIQMEQKPFAVGVRIEHKRQMIDKSQYGRFYSHTALGAAEYKLASNSKKTRGVYTFCMCPGGEVVPAASEEGRLVVNGMSQHARNAENTNSALLVGVGPKDFDTSHPLSGVEYQRRLEEKAFKFGGGDYKAPVQLVGDFMKNRNSTSLGDIEPSYSIGYTFANLNEILPRYVSEGIKDGLPVFDRRIKGFASHDAVLTGIESRSSSPVRIVRNFETNFCNIKGILPCGEGAGYAGGIMSAAVDGISCAEAIINHIKQN